MEFIAVISSITLAAIFIIACINKQMSQEYPDSPESKKELNLAKRLFSILPKLFITVVIFMSLTIIVPSTKTMYLIAGSEIGEGIVVSETGKRVQEAINKKLDEYLTEPE